MKLETSIFEKYQNLGKPTGNYRLDIELEDIHFMLFKHETFVKVKVFQKTGKELERISEKDEAELFNLLEEMWLKSFM